jgi:hypothetical protein
MADSEAVAEEIPVVEEVTVTSGQTDTEEAPKTPGKHVRAGFTKSHNQGQSKQRRKMAKASRRINRQRR